MIKIGSSLTVVGSSKTEYKFDVYTISNFDDIDFDAEGGIYIFTRRKIDDNGKYRHQIIYCGKTNDLSSRFNNHHKEKDIIKHHANCICVKIVSTENERDKIERDILEGNNFPCNDQLN
ncbi:GIY-YIG nuclease family protein [uncultured Alistipes sp.]|uniref:GIY-YIG nuclease family protein n=1 Tax=uncultured Alistipes sp. TaxID=538949 RepID=UPI0027298A8A|nr:GIY-YIG nuclease family protein [uncultured Alistipes sp.]